jgi:hypothetical protein
MPRTILFSRQFPQGHPKAGEPTWFVEKIIHCLIYQDAIGYGTESVKRLRDLGYLKISQLLYGNPLFKHHTIRAGHRFKKGDLFSPRVWSGKPYRSKQITLGPPVEIVNTWNFDVDENGVCSLNSKYILSDTLDMVDPFEAEIAKNDGLSYDDFNEWIVMPCYRKGVAFRGQVICWSKEINYKIPE